MIRTHFLPVLTLLAAGSAYAGQVYIGGPDGLTANYITVGGTVAGNTGGWAQRSYAAALFNSFTLSNASSNGATSVPTSTSAPGNGAANTITDDNLGITYHLVNDGTGASGNLGGANNIWAGISNGTFVVPVNLPTVSWVGIMLNDYWGFAGANPSLTFNFQNAGAVTVVLPDTASGSGPNNATGPIRAATDCQTATGLDVSCAGKTSGSPTRTVAGGNPITSPSSIALNTNLATTFNISWATIWSADYTSNTGSANGAYHCNGTSNAAPCVAGQVGNTSGKVVLDDLKIDFNGNYSNDTLLSIGITPNSIASGTNISRLALSAITVNQADAAAQATPEPGTFALLIGAGVMFAGGRRFRRS